VGLLATMVFLALPCYCGDTTLSDDEIGEAIALGKQYKNLDKLWDRNFRRHTRAGCLVSGTRQAR